MTLGLEIGGAFLAGIVFTILVLVVSAKPLMRWSMRRMMEGMIIGQLKSSGMSNVKVDLK